MTAAAVAAVAAVFLLAAVVQAVTGFGFALVAVPLLALVIDPVAAVVATTAVSLLLSVAAIRDDRDAIRWREAAIVTAAGVLGMPLGLLVLARVPAELLTAVIAVVLLASTVVVARRPRLPAGRGPEIGVGVLSGALLTSTGMNGPPLVVAFQARGMPPRAFRGTLAAVFLAQGVVALALLAFDAKVTATSLAAAAVGVPMLAVGWLVGNRAFHRLDPALYRRLVLALLVVSALVALGSAIADLRAA
jgi:uncharacterized protein